MKSSELIAEISPVINKITFTQKGKITLHLVDGRVLIVPLRYYPSIKKLSVTQRKKHTIADGEVVIFKDADEVFHIEQFLGVPSEYEYHLSKKAEDLKDAAAMQKARKGNTVPWEEAKKRLLNTAKRK
ncbi:MAG: DUF2442 domain-containing protein [Lacibacter sp.]|jgi:hypothetical protein